MRNVFNIGNPFGNPLPALSLKWSRSIYVIRQFFTAQYFMVRASRATYRGSLHSRASAIERNRADSRRSGTDLIRSLFLNFD